jgi:hypothetical protein
MKRFTQLTLCAMILLSIAACWPTTAQAGGPFGNDCWNGWGINGGYGLYGYRVNEVPYFSMFPPVYYSLPVPRSYGWSPFAYPPGTMTPPVQTAAAPQEIINPHVPQKPGYKPSSTESTIHTTGYQPPEPQVIVNPFVKTASETPDASTRMAAR